MPSVQQRRRIAAPADTVWQVVRDFAGIHEWVPAVAAPMEILGDPAVVGAERVLRTDGEISFAERLVSLDDGARMLSYTISKSAMPLRRHLATIVVRPDADAAEVEWSVDFDADEDAVAGIGSMFEQLYANGLEGLAERTERQAP
jgi:hypothetical protein